MRLKWAGTPPELGEDFERGALRMQEHLRGKGTGWSQLVDVGWAEIAGALGLG